MVTRSQFGIVKPLERFSLHTASISPILKTPFVTLQNSHWRQAMLDEYNALIKNGTWILVPKPAGVNMVRSMWLFKHKFHANGTLSRYKALLVANGSSQQQGIDVDETFSPVVKPATIHTVLSLARSLYGLKQAPRAWFQRFAGYAIWAGFYHNRCDTSLFIYQQGSQEFDMTDLGTLNYFLGISATRSSTGLFLSHKKYACELFERANMSQTPVDTDSKLGPEGVVVQDPTLYRSLAGGLQYLTFTHPDLSYAVQQICDNLLSWSSKRQHTISSSSAEAEYRGVANVVAETVWLRNLLRELDSPLSTATLTSHIRVLHVPSRYQYADIFTKGLPTALFEDFRSSLSVRLPPAQSAEAY
uniref:Ribonuclease H-like domain-containing protein n=1 Tax=Tanacetum cinerariifolium TaxID=118510 RepID=A0A6L2N708_TANCI|nr:ribonuclease H-like domain-containing protein [Tanacetum cinerariifolium]